MILVVGATGMVGGEICRLLSERGLRFRALIRKSSSPEKIGRLSALGAEIARGDLKEPESLAAACRGVSTVISTVSSTLSRQEGDSIESVDRQGQLNLIEAAEAAGAGHFVFISFRPIELEFPLQSAKREVEDRLRRSRMPYTILQPTCFMEVWLGPALGFDPASGTVRVYGDGSHKVSWISFQDVARFAVAALDHSPVSNAVVPLGGPDALSPLEVVGLAEKLVGTPIAVQLVPDAVLGDQYEAATDPLQRSFAALMIYCARGDVVEPPALPDFSPVTGLKTVAAYLQAALRRPGSPETPSK